MSLEEGILSMTRKITLDWSYPMDINNILVDSRMNDIGIYYITRNFGGKISDLYIGKTTYSFGRRLESHNWFWLDDYRGSKQVRLGYLVSPKRISEDDKKQLINDAEMTLIWLMGDSLIHNKQCIKTCSPKNRLYIKNIGYRGNLLPEMFFTDEQWNG